MNSIESFWAQFPWSHPIIPIANHYLLAAAEEWHNWRVYQSTLVYKYYLISLSLPHRTESTRMAYLRYDIAETRCQESSSYMQRLRSDLLKQKRLAKK